MFSSLGLTKLSFVFHVFVFSSAARKKQELAMEKVGQYENWKKTDYLCKARRLKNKSALRKKENWNLQIQHKRFFLVCPSAFFNVSFLALRNMILSYFLSFSYVLAPRPRKKTKSRSWRWKSKKIWKIWKKTLIVVKPKDEKHTKIR